MLAMACMSVTLQSLNNTLYILSQRASLQHGTKLMSGVMVLMPSLASLEPFVPGQTSQRPLGENKRGAEL